MSASVAVYHSSSSESGNTARLLKAFVKVTFTTKSGPQMMSKLTVTDN